MRAKVDNILLLMLHSFFMQRLLFLFLIVLSVILSAAAQAVMVLPLNVTQMTQQAGQIFMGRCTKSEILLDENNIPSTQVRFLVISGFKGVVDGEEVGIKQFGVTKQPLRVVEGESVIVPAKSMAVASQNYEVGQEYLLFFYPESSLGFTSPVGAGQGKFQILVDSHGEKSVINPFENKFLKEFVRKKGREGPINLQEMTQTVERLVFDASAS